MSGTAKWREQILEGRREGGAFVIDEFQPHLSEPQFANPQSVATTDPYALTAEEKAALKAFVDQLSSIPASPIEVRPAYRMAVRRLSLVTLDGYEDANPSRDERRPTFAEISGLERSVTDEWSEAHFLALCNACPKAAAHLLLDLMDAIVKLRHALPPEPPFQAVAPRPRPLVERRPCRRIEVAA